MYKEEAEEQHDAKYSSIKPHLHCLQRSRDKGRVRRITIYRELVIAMGSRLSDEPKGRQSTFLRR